MKTINKLQVFYALGMATAAELDDHVYIVGRNIFTPHITIIIVFPIKWTDVLISHLSPLVTVFIPYTALAVPIT